MKKVVFKVSKYWKGWIELTTIKTKKHIVVLKEKSGQPEEGWSVSGGMVIKWGTASNICERLILRAPHPEPDFFVKEGKYSKYQKFYQKTIWHEDGKMMEKEEVVSPRGFYHSIFPVWEDTCVEMISYIENIKKDDYFDGQIYMASPNYIVHFDSGNIMEFRNLPEEGQKYLVNKD